MKSVFDWLLERRRRMVRIKRKVKIKDGVEFDGQSYAGFTGTTAFKAENGIWWIDLDESCISQLSYEYRKLCEREGSALDAIYLEEDSFEFAE
jgi:hypothetical protein